MACGTTLFVLYKPCTSASLGGIKKYFYFSTRVLNLAFKVSYPNAYLRYPKHSGLFKLSESATTRHPMKFFPTILLIFNFLAATSQDKTTLEAGSEQVPEYLPEILGRNVAVVANHTSLVKGVHLVDTLLSSGVKVRRIFSPEHGFRGNFEAGIPVASSTDYQTGLPVVSLYGGSKQPTKEQLRDIEVVLFDLQDVGVRFYTYLSTLHYMMEACAINNVRLIVLDRPNPNGFYVDGPVLDTANRSFVGLHPVPLVYGMTVGEFALMINGEGWLSKSRKCNLSVIPCKGYSHRITMPLPVKPSPNLPNHLAVLLYPSLGLFEGTAVSVGRGTDYPFQMFGYPAFPLRNFWFLPVEKKGASTNPPYKGKKCYGIDLRDYPVEYFLGKKSLNIEWLVYAYNTYPTKSKFFNSFFRLLAGTDELQRQIEGGMSADEIRRSWSDDLAKYRLIRKKYLLYSDFD